MAIKDMQAFGQKADYTPLVGSVLIWTDIDGLFELPNHKYVIFESKKDTRSHIVENVSKTNQWQTYKNFMYYCCNTNAWFIYATHNEEISDRLIPADKFKVKFVRNGETEINLEGKNISLVSYLNRIGSIGLYYITVTYPDGTKEYCLEESKNNKWSIPKYESVKCCFSSEDTARRYVETRFKKDFNQSYTYTIYKVVSETKQECIARIKYTESEDPPEGLDGYTYYNRLYGYKIAA